MICDLCGEPLSAGEAAAAMEAARIRYEALGVEFMPTAVEGFHDSCGTLYAILRAAGRIEALEERVSELEARLANAGI